MARGDDNESGEKANDVANLQDNLQSAASDTATTAVLNLLRTEAVKSKKYSYIISIVALIVAFVLFIISSFITSLNFGGEKTSKERIKAELTKAISNKADIAVINQIYKNRKIDNRGITISAASTDSYYTYDTPLSSIIEDIRADQYLNDNVDEQFLGSLNKIYNDHIQKNPFDKLENYQKDYFESIRTRIPDKYTLIQNDILKIADEMHNKNLLVTKYLKDAQISFWISIIALILSTILAGKQIIEDRKNKKQIQNLINKVSDLQNKEQLSA